MALYKQPGILLCQYRMWHRSRESAGTVDSVDIRRRKFRPSSSQGILQMDKTGL